MSFKFIVIEHPPVKKIVKITQGNKGPAKNLELNWRGLSREQAGAALEVLECASASYMVSSNDGDLPLRPSEAIENWVVLKGEDGEVNVPQLHDGVYERTLRDIIVTRQEAMRAFIAGDGDLNIPGVTEAILTELPEETLLESWNMVSSDDEMMDFTDPETYSQVFSYNEFFFPIWDSMVEALGEMARGESKSKNSKNSANSSQRHGGRMRA